MKSVRTMPAGAFHVFVDDALAQTLKSDEDLLRFAGIYVQLYGHIRRIREFSPYYMKFGALGREWKARQKKRYESLAFYYRLLRSILEHRYGAIFFGELFDEMEREHRRDYKEQQMEEYTRDLLREKLDCYCCSRMLHAAKATDWCMMHQDAPPLFLPKCPHFEETKDEDCPSL